MLKIAVFDTHAFERVVFNELNQHTQFNLSYFDVRLTPETASMAEGASVVCAFANDKLNRQTLEKLKKLDVKLIALRSAGFNHVDIKAAQELGLKVVRVPAYSPYAVAEHAVALLLSLNRKTHRAYLRVKELNFSLDGLVGFDIHGKTVGVIGTGKIGQVFAKILLGFGAKVLCYDKVPSKELQTLGGQYVSLETLYASSDIISLHIPLTNETKHLIDAKALSLMKKGVFIINTGRGALIDSTALIQSLKAGHIGAAGLDVYEEEENIFFKDLSESGLQDDTLARLLTFPNVLITSHQGFLTKEALHNIVEITLENIQDFAKGLPLKNAVLPTN